VTVGTQAAVLAGLDITMFVEFQPPDNLIWVCMMGFEMEAMSNMKLTSLVSFSRLNFCRVPT
jgi:hypothetical protein